MLDAIHVESIKVDVYPDEFKPIMKAIKYALLELIRIDINLD